MALMISTIEDCCTEYSDRGLGIDFEQNSKLPCTVSTTFTLSLTGYQLGHVCRQDRSLCNSKITFSFAFVFV